MRIYIAGPISLGGKLEGDALQANLQAFHHLAAQLRAAGHHVENPAENQEPPCKTWHGWMRLGIAQLVTCDAIALLPGWQKSRGACIEAELARVLGLSIYLPEATDLLLQATTTTPPEIAAPLATTQQGTHNRNV